MAIGENEGRKIYFNIKEGRLHYKDPKSGEKKDAGTLSGTIINHSINQKEWQGKKYEELALTIVDGEEKYLLQINVNSGYFRAFVNQIRNGDPTQRVKLSPSYKVEDGKKNSSMFVEQGGKSLPWYSTSKDKKDVPAAKAVTVNGETLLDRADQNNYWKTWLAGVKWGNEFEASSITQMPVKTETKVGDEQGLKVEGSPFSDDNEDLPF